jgi:uncharacterized protein YecE (DUF72 family)
VTILCGTCAWADHAGFFPPSLRPQERLSFYARYFPLVEVDSTFYGIPEPSVAAAWVRQTPPTFVFDVKAYRTLTLHDRGQVGELQRERDWSRFLALIEVLAAFNKLGQVLFQFPPWFVRSASNQTYVERLATRLEDIVFGIEFRHRSWWDEAHRDETAEWLRELGAVNVVCDEPQVGNGTIPFVPVVTNPRLVVFRLHGRNAETWYQKGLTSSQQRFDYRYRREELATFLPFVTRWAEEAQAVHILMNNNQADYAVQNAFDWLDLLGIHHPPRPTGGGSEQLRLFTDD